MNTVYNIVSVVFLLLSLVVIVVVGGVMLGPPAEEFVFLPTQGVVPTATLTFTPTPTLTSTPTLTPTITLTPTPTVTVTQTPTTTPTITPSPSLTPTPTVTNTPEIVEEPTIDPAAASAGDEAPPDALEEAPADTVIEVEDAPPNLADSPSPFPFALAETGILYEENFANTAGCDWQGIAGQVFGLDGRPIEGLIVNVAGADTDFEGDSRTGDNTLYGVGGYEVVVDTTINANLYIVEVRTEFGTPISEPIEVRFPGDCVANLARVNFEQQRPF